MYSNYILKQTNSDFIVSEEIDINLTSGSYHYYHLEKNGYKTIDVIEILSKEFNVNRSSISYAGLKDEDAITFQKIAIKDFFIEKYIYNSEPNIYFLIKYIGSANEPLKIGSLRGNHFQIKIRNLTYNIAKSIFDISNGEISVLNYYGIQRFGMPHKPKKTHLIGKFLLMEDYDNAFFNVKETGSITYTDYDKWKRNSKEFFIKQDPRIINFYLGSWDSFVWNNAIIKNIMSRVTPSEIVYLDDIIFLFTLPKNIPIISSECQSIFRHRLNFDNNTFSITTKESKRMTNIELYLHALFPTKDNLNPDKYMIELDFTLPSGSYATTVIDQLIWIATNQ